MHVCTFTDAAGVQRTTRLLTDCDHETLHRLDDPRVAAYVDLVAFGERPAFAAELIVRAENFPGRTVNGAHGMVAYDLETGWCPARMPA